MTDANKESKQSVNYNWKKVFIELFVVFLGVTAGFLLNNWQNQRKDELLEKKYLNAFLRDAEKNIIELEKAIRNDSLWIEKMKPKLKSIKSGAITVDSAVAAVKEIISLSAITFQMGAYENITNSGNLNLIQDYELREKVVDYYVGIEDVKFVDDYYFKYVNSFIMPFVVSNFSLLRGNFSNPKVIKTVEFENAITGFFSLKRQQKSQYEKMLNKSRQLKSELNKLGLEVD